MDNNPSKGYLARNGDNFETTESFTSAFEKDVSTGSELKAQIEKFSQAVNKAAGVMLSNKEVGALSEIEAGAESKIEAAVIAFQEAEASGNTEPHFDEKYEVKLSELKAFFKEWTDVAKLEKAFREQGSIKHDVSVKAGKEFSKSHNSKLAAVAEALDKES